MFVIAIACDQFEAIFSDETLVGYQINIQICGNSFPFPGRASQEARSLQTEEAKTGSAGRGELVIVGGGGGDGGGVWWLWWLDEWMRYDLNPNY